MAEFVDNRDTDVEDLSRLSLDFRTGERGGETQRRSAHPLVIGARARRDRNARPAVARERRVRLRICAARIAHLHALPER